MKKIFKNIKYEKYYKDVLPYLKKDRNQQYFAIILTFSASIFFALFAINPTLSTIAKLKKEVADNKLVDQRLSEKINNLSLLSSAYQNIENDISFVTDAIPSRPEAPTLVAQIQSIANDSGVSISGLTITPVNLIPKESAKSSAFIFEFSAQGDFEKISKFISDIVNMQRIVSINGISISKANPRSESESETEPDTGSDNDLNANIKGSVYFKK